MFPLSLLNPEGEVGGPRGGAAHLLSVRRRRGGQEGVTCNGGALHCGRSTLITPFTITATYHPTPQEAAISTTTQMKWIIVSLCGIS